MKTSNIKMSKGKGKRKHGPLRSVTISRAKNGFMVSKEHEPMPDENGNMQYAPSEAPAVFNGDNAMADAHAHSQSAFGADGGDMGSGDMGEESQPSGDSQ
jgi:hypothetical protein